MGIKRILIANRGSIAVRIIRTLNKMGLESVAVYHEDEKKSSYFKAATYSVNLGKGPLSDNFLNIEKIIEIALTFHCDAIHPGYGFLSENYLFAKACENNNIKFIGPESSVIRLMGLKSKAKEVAIEAKVPIIEGKTIQHSTDIDSDHIEYPVLIKAIAGGGGKGLKIVRTKNALEQAFDSAKREALHYFGNDELIMEPYIDNARHIEIQVLGNEHGEIIHLFERECSIQRNHQKIIEEAPAPNLSTNLKEKLYAAAVRYAAQLNYTGVGTVEFLVSDNKFWFLEMNTRIQVEHAVTELITGVDIVEEQIHIANGNQFSNALKAARTKGHAMEARVYAENPYKNFQPSAGEICYVNLPKAVRMDTFIETGTIITPHFDSLLGKMVVYENNRTEAINALTDKLGDLKILGIETNINYLSQIINHNEFRVAKLATTFLEKKHGEFIAISDENRANRQIELFLAAFIFKQFIQPKEALRSIWNLATFESQNRKLDIYIEGQQLHKVTIKHIERDFFRFVFNDKEVTINVVESNKNKLTFLNKGKLYNSYFASPQACNFDIINLKNRSYKISSPHVLYMASAFIKKDSQNMVNGVNQIKSPLFGKVISINTKTGAKIREGDVLLVLESMKTENNILAPTDGIVEKVLVDIGSQVAENTELITLGTR